jgi:hypothetical protein
MNIHGNPEQVDLSLDRENLYREESYTDLKVGAIRRLVPVRLDGGKDPSRTEVFVGSTQLMTPEGPLPVQARLMANNFQEAVEAFPSAMAAAVREMVQELQKLAEEHQRNDDSRIIVPGRS